MYIDLINQRKKDFDSVIEFVRSEIAAIRTGRATPALVEGIRVEYFGSLLGIKELATITVPEPRMLLIQPWDKNVVSVIEKGIRESELGLNPVVDGQIIRLTIPPLSEERRKEFVRILHQKIEETRIKARHIREDILRKVQDQVREKLAREDDLHKAKDELQKVMDNLNGQLQELSKKKEQELMNS